MMDNAYQNSSNIKNDGGCNNLNYNNELNYTKSSCFDLKGSETQFIVADVPGENEYISKDSKNIDNKNNNDINSPNKRLISDNINFTNQSETECEYKILPSYISKNSDNSESNSLFSSCSNKKCEHYLPSYIKWNENNNNFC